MTERTPNGWEVLEPNDKRLVAGVIPGTHLTMRVRNDQLGFLCLYWAAWWNVKVERLDGNLGCYAYRDRRGSSAWSEHAGAAADDLKTAKHPQGVPIKATFTPAQIATIRRGIKWLNRLALGKVAEWGGEWPSHPGSTALTDGMHTQFYPGRVLFLVRRVLVRTKIGKAVRSRNPHLKIKW